MIFHPVQTLLKAADFCAIKHRGQTRADGSTPYVAHLTRVALVLSQVFGVRDLDSLSAALLHDALEDTDTDYEELAEKFGERTADYVVALTKNALLPKRQREIDYQIRLLAAPEQVRILKLADLFDNLSMRVGTAKFPRTLLTAKRLTTAFQGTFRSAEGKSALVLVRRLLTSIATNSKRRKALKKPKTKTKIKVKSKAAPKRRRH